MPSEGQPPSVLETATNTAAARGAERRREFFSRIGNHYGRIIEKLTHTVDLVLGYPEFATNLVTGVVEQGKAKVEEFQATVAVGAKKVGEGITKVQKDTFRLGREQAEEIQHQAVGKVIKAGEEIVQAKDDMVTIGKGELDYARKQVEEILEKTDNKLTEIGKTLEQAVNEARGGLIAGYRELFDKARERIGLFVKTESLMTAAALENMIRPVFEIPAKIKEAEAKMEETEALLREGRARQVGEAFEGRLQAAHERIRIDEEITMDRIIAIEEEKLAALRRARDLRMNADEKRRKASQALSQARNTLQNLQASTT